MKKSLIISTLFLTLLTSVKALDIRKNPADESPYKTMEIGFRMMPTFSSFNMTTSSGGTVKGQATLGFGIGAMLACNITRHVGIQGEIIYNSLSQKYKDKDLDREFNIRYINIPLMLSLNTNKANAVNLNFVFGPQLGINVGSGVNSSSNTNSDTFTTVLTTKKSDFGFAYGAGVEFLLNSARTLRLDLGYRGIYGLVNISNTREPANQNSAYILEKASVRTNAAYLGITFLF